MAVTHGRSNRTKTGAKRSKSRKKRKTDLGRESPNVVISEKVKKKVVSTVGGKNDKVRLMATNMANVLDPKSGMRKVVKILDVKDNKANRHYARRDIITKGAIIATEAGDARVTSRPGQHGVVNAVLV